MTKIKKKKNEVSQLTQQQILSCLLWPDFLPKIQLHSEPTHSASSHVLPKQTESIGTQLAMWQSVSIQSAYHQ